MTTSFCEIPIPNPVIAIKTQEFLKGRSAQYPRSSGPLGDTAMNALFMKIQEHFIHEKIAIPSVAPRTSRPRLLKLLTGNLNSANATIINGRAGSGKSVLATDFARHVGRAVAWYKVEAADNDLRVFCEYLAAAVRRQRPSIDAKKALLELIKAVESDRAELLAEAFVFQLSETRAEPLLIVIEDLHQVYDGDWVVPFFRRLLPLLPADVHVLITCRSLPPTPLWRMRSKQMLRVLDESELAFTLEEAIALFDTYGLSEKHARAAWNETNGRAATIAEFAATPGRAGRAVADDILSFRHSRFSSLPPTPDFQT
ncbi:MAG TPA: AAA family ATPase [Pyrinomonadaceae bacterium]|nr:AAA family ATPase [Pyrinomonadaceae bacterium]